MTHAGGYADAPDDSVMYLGACSSLDMVRQFINEAAHVRRRDGFTVLRFTVDHPVGDVDEVPRTEWDTLPQSPSGRSDEYNDFLSQE